MNSSIFQNVDVIERVKNEWLEIWSINEAAGSEMGLIWDTMKSVMRGLIIKEMCKFKRSKEENIKKLEDVIKNLEHKYLVNRDNRMFLELQAKRKELDSIDLDKVQRDLMYMKRRNC